MLSFMLSFDVIIFRGQQMLLFSIVHFGCCHLCYYLMLSFHGQQMLSFVCYHLS